MNNYTVITLKPDYSTGEHSSMSHITHTVANSAHEACYLGQLDACVSDEYGTGKPVLGNPKDYTVLCCFTGYHMDMLDKGETLCT